MTIAGTHDRRIYAPIFLEPMPAVVPRPRTLHVVDLDSQLGTFTPTTLEVSTWWTRYANHSAGVHQEDQMILNASASASKVAWFVLPESGIQRRIGLGSHFTMSLAELRHLAGRFERVVIASGHRMFAEVALGFEAAGVRVHQVIGKATPSPELLVACSSRTYL